MRTALRTTCLMWVSLLSAIPVCLTEAVIGAQAPITIGRKDFVEQDILCEIVKQHIQRRLGAAARCSERLAKPHDEILAGKIDAYVEYAGTAYSTNLRQAASTDRRHIMETIQSEYRSRGLLWLRDLGFENTFVMVVRRDEAVRHHVRKLSEANAMRPEWRFGSGPDFQVRPDGLSGLLTKYQLRLRGRPTTSTIDAMFRFLQVGAVDMIAANSTDPLVDDVSVLALEDDLHYFPPYSAAIVLRKQISDRQPALVSVLNELAGTISAPEMARLQTEGNSNRQTAEKAAEEFLARLRPRP